MTGIFIDLQIVTQSAALSPAPTIITGLRSAMGKVHKSRFFRILLEGSFILARSCEVNSSTDLSSCGSSWIIHGISIFSALKPNRFGRSETPFASTTFLQQ